MYDTCHVMVRGNRGEDTNGSSIRELGICATPKVYW